MQDLEVLGKEILAMLREVAGPEQPAGCWLESNHLVVEVQPREDA